MKEVLDTQLDSQLFDYELESVNGKNILITGEQPVLGVRLPFCSPHRERRS